MQPRDIVVIGGSAGSIEALKTILGGLRPGLPAAVFVALHLSADFPSMLATVLSRSVHLLVTKPSDEHPIERGHIYVVSPDHHLTIEDGKIRVLRGPRENRHRPAIDRLFRTAARQYGSRVIGVILSGLQDDGAAGLFAVKHRGGLTIVQDPNDATWKEMPMRAIEYIKPDYILPAADIAPILVGLINPQEGELAMAGKNSVSRKSNGGNQKQKHARAGADVGKPDVNEHIVRPSEGEGVPSVFACPECHGVLWELKDEKLVRFRCRVGHSYGAESLTRELSMASEAALWAAVRALEEKAAMQRRVAEGMGMKAGISARLLDQSESDSANARRIRDMIFRRDAELEPQEVDPEELEQEKGKIA